MLHFCDNYLAEKKLLPFRTVARHFEVNGMAEVATHLFLVKHVSLGKNKPFLMKKVIALAFVTALILSTAAFAQDKMKDDKMKKDKMSSSSMNDDKMAKGKMSDGKMMDDKMSDGKMSGDKMKMKKTKMKMKKDSTQ